MQRRAALLGLLLTAVAGFAAAQGATTFSARLDWVPIGGAERRDVGGSGKATATLSRSQLSITGTFEGLPAAATRASLHRGVAIGARGPAIAEIEITKSESGSFSGAVALDREQRDALLAGHLYVQLHAERGVEPDNAVLWGWLLADRPASSERRSSR